MNSVYFVSKADYKEFLINNGLQQLGNKIEQDIKNNQAEYYVIYKNNKLYADFALYPEENNLITLERVYWQDIELINTILKSVEDCEYLSLNIFYDSYDEEKYKLIKNNFEIISEEDFINYSYNIKKVSFKK